MALFVVMISEMYTYLQTSSFVDIKCVQSFAYQSYLNRVILKKMKMFELQTMVYFAHVWGTLFG